MVDSLKSAAEAGLDLVVVCDDAYFGLFYEQDCETESIFVKLVQAHERILAIKIDGSTKEDLVWGFRIGFMTFGSKNLSQTHYHALLQKLMGTLRSSVSSSPGISQHLLVKTLESPTYSQEKVEFKAIMLQRYKKVRSVLTSALAKETSNLLEPLPFNSGYFMSFLCHQINAEDLRLALLEKGIGTISIDGKYLRIAFSSVDNTYIEDLYQEIFHSARELSGS